MVKKIARRLSLAAFMAFALAFSALATDSAGRPDFDYSGVMTEMGGSMQDMSQSVISNVMPIIWAGLIIFGFVIAVRVGISLFRRFTGRV